MLVGPPRGRRHEGHHAPPDARADGVPALGRERASAVEAPLAARVARRVGVGHVLLTFFQTEVIQLQAYAVMPAEASGLSDAGCPRGEQILYQQRMEVHLDAYADHLRGQSVVDAEPDHSLPVGVKCSLRKVPPKRPLALRHQLIYISASAVPDDVHLVLRVGVEGTHLRSLRIHRCEHDALPEAAKSNEVRTPWRTVKDAMQLIINFIAGLL
mmetsp:Transcript_36961/g.88555  ORF Transcript_36961/g.88555 Transcript_36961/m.88555 type:complete len:213 (+) Transcript_36961:1014-1652(+)